MEQHADRMAIADAHGLHGYAELRSASARVAAGLLKGRDDLAEARIGFLITPGFAWTATLLGIWRAGGIAVPLPQGAARPELEYFIETVGTSALVGDAPGLAGLAPLEEATGLHPVLFDELAGTEEAPLPEIDSARRAMILFTSGTTSRPKGVVSTHANIAAQIHSLVTAWEWTAEDSVVLCLPLHHVHGIINVVCCALWSGALCRMLSRFDADAVWGMIAAGELTLLMAVPTIYVRLIAAWEAATPERRKELSEAASKMRRMISGSAALPVSTLARWKEITGQSLLERYGMTEIGMALSNPLYDDGVPGHVGWALPGVFVRLAGEDGAEVPAGTPGEIEVQGENVFKEYWNRPEATREAFRDGWFRTGDTAMLEEGGYRILGRTSIDILKSGGHKISALEIEEVLRTHPEITECAVVGVADAEWGERVAAALVLREGCAMDLSALRAWGRELMAAYKLPSLLLVVEQLPRNAMGKVVKPEVTKLFIEERARDGE